MAKDRQRAREARQQARAQEVAAAARRRDRVARRAAVRARLTPVVPRRRYRYGALATFDLVRLGLVFLAVQGAVWLFATSDRVRFAAAVLTLAVLAVIVRTRRSTPR